MPELEGRPRPEQCSDDKDRGLQWHYFLSGHGLDGDGTTPNPDPRDGQLKQIRARVLVYSAGPDQDPATWADNLVSW